MVYLSQARKVTKTKTVQELLKEDKAMMKKLVASIAKLPSIDTFGNKESKDFLHFKMRLTHSLKDFKRNKQFINSL
jgi:hypothetical protein